MTIKGRMRVEEDAVEREAMEEGRGMKNNGRGG
jgi:hypothetical protein